MAELVGDVPDGEAGVVEAGGPGPADPRVAGPAQCGPEVGLGVGRVAKLPGRGGEHRSCGTAVQPLALLQGGEHRLGLGEDALRGRGLGAWLDLQSHPGDAHDGGVDVDGADVVGVTGGGVPHQTT